jgi:hypothetical protein
MTSPHLASNARERPVRVTVLGSGGQGVLAAAALARHFGRALAEVEALLLEGHGVLAAAAPLAVAQAGVPLMRVLGLRVQIEPTGAADVLRRHDLSIRLRDPKAQTEVMRRLSGLGLAVPSDFNGPAGCEIRGLISPQVDAVLGAFKDMPLVQTVVSAQSDAVYDLFSTGQSPVALRRHLMMMGHRPDRLIAAIATDLDLSALTHVLGRFPTLGLLGVNQRFQRYRVILTGVGRLSRSEVQDFLASRGLHAQRSGMTLVLTQGLRIEDGLSRAAVRQFQADYATIGIPTRAELQSA